MGLVEGYSFHEFEIPFAHCNGQKRSFLITTFHYHQVNYEHLYLLYYCFNLHLRLQLQIPYLCLNIIIRIALFSLATCWCIYCAVSVYLWVASISRNRMQHGKRAQAKPRNGIDSK